jgi:hypothetical protein
MRFSDKIENLMILNPEHCNDSKTNNITLDLQIHVIKSA